MISPQQTTLLKEYLENILNNSQNEINYYKDNDFIKSYFEGQFRITTSLLSLLNGFIKINKEHNY